MVYQTGMAHLFQFETMRVPPGNALSEEEVF